MSQQKAKICPECGGCFYHRRRVEDKMCCPRCDTPIVLKPNGQVMTERDHGRRIEVLKSFEAMCKLQVHFRPGSSNYIKELGLAGKLIAASAKYLSACDRFDIDTTDFAIQCMEYMFTMPNYSGWAHKVNSISMCNGKIFDSIAPKVFKQIVTDEKCEQTAAMREQAIDMGQFNVQYGL